MKDVLHLARTQLVTALRERITLFWFLIFPLFLLALLGFIFTNVGKTQDLTFEITVVNLDRGAMGGNFGASVVETFRQLAQPSAAARVPLFRVHEPEAGKDAATYLAQEIESLRIGKRAAVVVVPADFSESLYAAAASQRSADEAPALVAVHTSGGRTSSDMALGVIEQVIARVDREILVKLGLFDTARGVTVDQKEIGAENKTFAYIDFLVPGVVVMGFFVAGLFSVPGTILFGRENRVLRRYWVTPLTVPRFLAGFTLGHVALCALQFICVWILGRFAFGAHVNLFEPLALAYLVLAVVTFLAIGFLVAAVARTPNAGMAIANIINMPLMFLGGLFFPTGSMPSGLRAVMLVDPVTYIADGLRASVGVSPATYGHAVSFAVPCAWILGCAAVAAFRLKWDVGR